MYVRRATGEKVAHRCSNGHLRHQLAPTNFNYVRACGVIVKALNDEICVRHVCKLLVILLLSFLGMRE